MKTETEIKQEIDVLEYQYWRCFHLWKALKDTNEKKAAYFSRRSSEHISEVRKLRWVLEENYLTPASVTATWQSGEAFKKKPPEENGDMM